MCGIFSYIAKPNKVADLGTLEKLAVQTERRGPHAFGLSWIDSRGRLQHYKRPGRISDHLYILDYLRDARMVVGHCRYVTQGSADYNSNNHPFACDGGWLVHNGRIEHHKELISMFDLLPNTDCDSEVISLLIEHFDGPLVDRCLQAATHCSLTDFAMVGLWARPARMIIIRAGKPLRVMQTEKGWYYASKASGMQREVVNNRCIVFNATKSGVPRIDKWEVDRLPAAIEAEIDDSHEYQNECNKPRNQQRLWHDWQPRVTY